jgi:hypothetical protein
MEEKVEGCEDANDRRTANVVAKRRGLERGQVRWVLDDSIVRKGVAFGD